MVNVVTYNSEPKIELHEDFLTPHECQEFLRQPFEFKNSQGWDATTDAPHYTEYRTSSSAYNSKLTNVLKQKISDYLSVDITTIEDLQVQRYHPGQEFKRHFDYFHSGRHLDNNRIATMIIYLNDNFTGGNTEFPRLNLSIKPKAGTGLYFEFGYDDPNINLLTEHSGNPVTYGVKYIVTAWFRKQPYRK